MGANKCVCICRVPDHLNQESRSIKPKVTRQDVVLTHKNLAGLLRKLVESLTLHLEDLHIEGEQVLPEHWDEALERYLYSPLHSFLSGHGTNQESGIHILESLRSCQMASKTEYVTFAGQRSN